MPSAKEEKEGEKGAPVGGRRPCHWLNEPRNLGAEFSVGLDPQGEIEGGHRFQVPVPDAAVVVVVEGLLPFKLQILRD